MLVLSRKKSQTIVIDVPPSTQTTRVEIMLVEILHLKKVRIGITAPPDVSIVRSEVKRVDPAGEPCEVGTT